MAFIELLLARKKGGTKKMDIKKLAAITSIFLLVFSFPACSVGNKTLPWENWRGLKKEKSIDPKNLDRFFSSIRRAPGNPESHYLLACFYQERGRHREAIEEFRKVISIDSEYVKAYNGLGISFDHLKNYFLAIESYKRALDLNPNLDYVQNNLGYSYLLLGNYDEASKAFEKAIALNPQEKRFHNNLGLAYAEKGQFDLALREFRKAGDEASAHYNVAQFYYKKGLYKEAQTYYGKALELNPSSSTFKAGFKAASVLAVVFDSPKNTEKSKAGAVLTPAISSPTQPEATPLPSLSPKENSQSQSPPPLLEESKIIGEYKTKPYEFISVNEASPSSRADFGKDLSNHAASPILSLLPKENSQPQALPLSKYSKNKNESSSQDFQKTSGSDPEPSFKMAIGYELQVASSRSLRQANFLADSLKNSGFPATVESWKDKRGYEWYRTILGPFMTRDEALSQKANVLKIRKGGNSFIRLASVKIDSANKLTPEQTFSSRDQIPLKTVGIEISNGNGVNGMARMIGNYLNENGIKVVRLTNASNFNHHETKIYYEKGYHKAANYLAGCFPAGNNLKELEKLDRSHVKVKILLGKDLIGRSKVQGSKQAS